MSALQLLVAVAIWGAVIGAAVITALKGQTLLFIAGVLFIGVVWFIAAPRLAKPNSYWARRFYGPEKLARSRARYPHVDFDSPNRAGLALIIAAGVFGLLFTAGLISGLAS